MTLSYDDLAAELAASGVALPLALARVGAQLAEEGRGLGQANASDMAPRYVGDTAGGHVYDP